MLYEILAAIESCDPSSAPLWGVFALSALMYPLGFLFPCDKGGICDCCCPLGETLPQHVLVEFGGAMEVPYGPEVDLLWVEFNSCFGDGAAAVVDEVGEAGEIAGVTLASGGSGYAVYAREVPTALSITGGSGGGAEFAITLSEAQHDDCGLSYWTIQSVEVEAAGDLYVDGDTLSVSLGDNENELQPASLTLNTSAGEPDITAEANTGSGALLAVTTKLVATDPDRWGVDAVQVTTSGTGFFDGDPVTFAAETGTTEETPAAGWVAVRRSEPESVVVDRISCTGTGAAFAPVFSKTTSFGWDAWEIDALIVQAGGSGYSVGCNIYFRKNGPATFQDAEAQFQVATIGAGGAVATVTKINGGKFFSLTDEIESVVVTNAGSYYGQSSKAETVTVNDGGRFYKTDFVAPAIKAAVTVTLEQVAPSNGGGAELSATVDDDKESPTFGEIISIAIGNAGSGYTKRGRMIDPFSFWFSGQSGILKRNGVPLNAPPEYVLNNCVYGSDKLWGYALSQSRVVVVYNGHRTPPTVTTWGGGTYFVMEPTGPVGCDEISFVAVSPEFDGTATVTTVVVEEE